MAIAARVVLPGISNDQYDQVRAEVGWLEQPPVGGISHLTWWDGNNCHSMDGWESEDALNTFASERLGPAMAKLGINVQPEIAVFPAHEVFTPQAVKII